MPNEARLGKARSDRLNHMWSGSNLGAKWRTMTYQVGQKRDYTSVTLQVNNSLMSTVLILASNDKSRIFNIIKYKSWFLMNSNIQR